MKQDTKITITLTPKIILRYAIIIAFILGLFCVGWYLIIPLVTGFGNSLIRIVVTYQSITDINFKFLGQIFFLFITWKILTAIITVMIMVFESLVKFLEKEKK